MRHLRDKLLGVLILVALISLWPIWRLYRKESVELPFLSIVIFLAIGLFGIFFSAMRQIIAIAFSPYAYYCTRQKNWAGFLATVLIASLFHKSALILMAMYPMYHLNFRKRSSLGAVILITAAVFFFRNSIFRFLTKAFSRTIAVTETGAISILLLLIILAIYSFFMVDNRAIDAEMIGLRNILFVCILIQVFASVNTLAMRLNYYFLLFIPLLVPKIAMRCDLRNRKIAIASVVVMTVFFTGMYFVKAYTGEDILQIYPYIPMWAQT